MKKHAKDFIEQAKCLDRISKRIFFGGFTLCVLIFIAAAALFVAFDHTGNLSLTGYARDLLGNVPGCVAVTVIGALLFDLIKKHDFPDEK